MKIEEKEAAFKDHPLRSMFIFLEKFIQGSEHLDRSVLEASFPYPLLHAAFVDMSLGRFRSSDQGASSQALFGASAVAEVADEAATI
jgi:hypothetical protein